MSKEDEGGCGIQQTQWILVDAGGLGIGGKVLAIQFRSATAVGHVFPSGIADT